jgi:ferredoxin
MAYVIAEPCIDVLDVSCVSVCPVDCIHYEEGTDRKLFIDPNECIDCGACVPECPVEAIFDETQLSDAQKPWIATNAEKSKGLPVINSKQDALPGAEERKEKLGF